MILKERLLWAQLDGPQARAFQDALWNHAIAKYNAKFDYFDKLSIETANSQHLDFIGRLMKVPRAVIIVEQYYNQLLHFSSEPERDVPDGFDSGKFAYAHTKADSVYYQTLDDMTYRKILSTLAQTDGAARGLRLIDVLCDHFLIRVHSDGAVKKIYYEILEDANIVGDIRVVIERTAGYNQMILEQVLNQLFTSVPKVRLLVDAQLRGGEI